MVATNENGMVTAEETGEVAVVVVVAVAKNGPWPRIGGFLAKSRALT